MVLSNNTQPPDPFQDAPRTLVYDPGKQIRHPTVQLAPFGSIPEFYHNERDLKKQIQNAQKNQLLLLLIFSNKDDVEVRCFLMKHIPNTANLRSLHIIFPNGVLFHDKWINCESMPKLCWCRSYTTQLIRDICDVCQLACNANITFYQQRMILAQDAVDRNTIDSADSTVILFAQEIKKFALLVQNYLPTYIQ